jgi:hypothetical protein
MNILRRSLQVLGASLESSQTLAETIAELERELALSTFARRVEIHYGDSPLTDSRFGELSVPLVLDGTRAGYVSYYFGAEPCQEDRDVTRLLAGPLAAALAWRAHTDARVPQRP